VTDALRCRFCDAGKIDFAVPPEDLFSDYVYVTGTSDLARRHAADLATRYATNGLVVEAGSNDGTVLAAFRERGASVLGVEPAANIAPVAQEAGIETIVRFFGEETGRDVRESHGQAALFLARHVFAHVPDPHDFVRGIEALLAPDGLALIEAPYLPETFERRQFDQVYHEHVSYLGARPMRDLFARYGLTLVDLQVVEIHGGSAIYAFRRKGTLDPAPSVAAAIEHEEACGCYDVGAWGEFRRDVETIREQVTTLLTESRDRGVSVRGYGAPAKGNTLLQYFGLGPDLLPWTADKSPYKHGLFTPGTHVPVVPAERIEDEKPDVLLVLAWNFADEIVRQQAAHAARGGRFFVPIPRLAEIPPPA
jgi:SAM-dependent methyltransferase